MCHWNTQPKINHRCLLRSSLNLNLEKISKRKCELIHISSHCCFENIRWVGIRALCWMQILGKGRSILIYCMCFPLPSPDYITWRSFSVLSMPSGGVLEGQVDQDYSLCSMSNQTPWYELEKTPSDDIVWRFHKPFINKYSYRGG